MIVYTADGDIWNSEEGYQITESTIGVTIFKKYEDDSTLRWFYPWSSVVKTVVAKGRHLHGYA